jgi:hypothetical protein
MNIKQLSIGTITGGVVLWLLGMLFWQMLFSDFLVSNAGSATGLARDPQITWALILGTLVYAAYMTHVITAKGSGASLTDGLKAGALVGFVIWFIANFMYFGLFNIYNLTGHVVDTVLEVIRGGIAGGAIALVVGKFSD